MGADNDRFLALLAHELRNPLAPLRTALELLGRPQVAEATKTRARDIMARQLTHMAELIDQLSDFARLGSGRITMQQECVSARDAVEAALESARAAMNEKQLVPLVDVAPRAVWLRADRARLVQALAMVLDEAARRSEPGRRVWLRAAAIGPFAVIAVRDEGMGQADESDLFAQLDEEHPAVAPQPIPQEIFSIGLALADRLAAAQGGRLQCRIDAASRGAEIALWMPLGEAPEG
jgi:signal transduction histidine kinase